MFMLAVTEVFRCILQEMEPHTVGGLLSSGVSEAHLAELYEIQQFIPCLLKGKKKHLLFWFCFVLSFICGLIWNSWAVARPWLTMMRRLTVDYLLHNGTPLIWGNKDSFTPDFLWKKRGKKGKGNLWWEGNVNNFIHFVKLEIQQRQKHPGAVSTIMGRGEKINKG